MANALVTLAYRVRGYGAPAKAVLVRLADLASADGTEARPTVQRLADELEMSGRAVQDALKRLRQAGVIIITAEAVGTRPRVYRLNVPLMRQLADAADASRLASGVQEVHPARGAGDAGVQDVHPYEEPRGAGGSPPGVQDVHPQPPLQPDDDVAGAARAPSLAAQVCDIAGADHTTHSNWHQIDSAVARWLSTGHTEGDVLTGVRTAASRLKAAGRPPPNSPNYFDNAVANAKAARLAPMPEGQVHASRSKRPDDRYDQATRRKAGAAFVAEGLDPGPDAAGYG